MAGKLGKQKVWGNDSVARARQTAPLGLSDPVFHVSARMLRNCMSRDNLPVTQQPYTQW